MIIRSDLFHRALLLAAALLSIAILPAACFVAPKSTDIEGWIELSYFIDATVEVRIDVPPAKVTQDLHQMQFLSSTGSTPVRIFAASYDQGKGRDRDLLLTYISGVVIQIDKEVEHETVITLEDIKNEVYLSRTNAIRRFEFEGEQVFSGRKWLKVNLKGEPHGLAYSSPISKDLVLILGMTVYGKDANKTSLFTKRQITMEEIVSRVRVSNVDTKF